MAAKLLLFTLIYKNIPKYFQNENTIKPNPEYLCQKYKKMKTEYQNAIISKLKLLRDKKGYSQATVARLLGISPGQLGNIESCKRRHKYTLKQILMLCREFDYPIADLFLLDAEHDNTVNNIVESIVRYEEGAQ